MRTTLDIDDDLLRRAKELAASTNRPLHGVIEDALRESLARNQKGKPRRRVRLPVSSQRAGLRPDVNLDCSGDLLDQMEGLDAPA
jgi:hypothetical protein